MVAAKRSVSKSRAAAKPKLPVSGAVLAAVRRDLSELRRVAPELAGSGLAATAVAMAREVDRETNSPTAKSLCARALFDVLGQLRALTPAREEGDRLDDLAARRATRRRDAAS